MPEPSDVQRASERFKAALLRNERAAASDMVRAYGGIWRRVKPQLDALLKSIEEAERRGEEVRPSDVARSERLRQLLAQVEQEVGQYAQYVDESVRRQQSAAIEAAAQNAEGLTRAAMGDAPTDEARLALRWNRLPREAMAELVGQLHNGAPLDILLGELGPEASQRVKDALLEGVAMGRNPRVIARDVRRSMGMPLTRSLRISRTETLRAHRLATLANFQANSDIIRGWKWSASHSSRTCLACLAMDGKVFPLDKPPPMHVSCRCSVIPVPVSWRDLGVDAPEPDLGPTGAEWFAAQPASVQREMMGDEAYKAWKAGRVTLDDFVGVRKSRRWGDSVGEVRLKDALGQHGQARDLGEMKARPLAVGKGAAVRRSLLDVADRYDTELSDADRLTAQYRRDLDEFWERGGNPDAPEFETIRKRWFDAQAAQSSITEARNEAVRALLRPNRGALRYTIDGEAGDTERLIIRDGVKAFASFFRADALAGDNVGFFIAPGSDRASYFGPLKAVSIPSRQNSWGVNEDTIVHELGHWLEDVRPDIRSKVQAFYDRRTAGEMETHLGQGYGVSEMTKVDKFIDPYMGKVYRNASEIVSMGIEYLVRDPARLARQDPDMFEFIIDLIEGA